MFAGWGRFVYRNRWATLIGSGVLLATSVVLLMMGGTLTSGGPLTSNLQSARAGNLITSELGVAKVTSNFDLIFRSDSLTVTDPQYQAAVADAGKNADAGGNSGFGHGEAHLKENEAAADDQQPGMRV